MRFVHIYLIGYFALTASAGLVLWQAGVLTRLSGISLAVAAFVTIGLGIILAITAGRPTAISRE